MSTVLAQFRQRVERIPFHGVGLSADAYQPDLYAVLSALDACGAPPDFVELFRASTPMLASIRARVPGLPMPYHAEGLWLTQPGWLSGEGPCTNPVPDDLVLAREQVRALRSAWLNHECASKVVGGYPFGTYLPPLFTRACAQVVADHARHVQAFLDAPASPGRLDVAEASVEAEPSGPLVLLELPPLTYFSVGDRPVGRFFRDLTERAPCGLVLDVGHLWTHYRYGPTRAGETLTQFVAQFLDDFPLERVVEIHVAGLACHPEDGAPARAGDEPRWLDTHGAEIPPVLFEMLEQILAQERLTALRGIALEVDTKPVDMIAAEFQAFRERFAPGLVQRHGRTPAPSPWPEVMAHAVPSESDAQPQGHPYVELERRYADLVLGRVAHESLSASEWPELQSLDARAIERYREQYLPYELLHWGGDVPEMFPRTCATLAAHGVPVAEFVAFWFAAQQAIPAPFDFFLLKLDRFLDFVRVRVPQHAEVLVVARQEADELRDAYACANEPVGVVPATVGGAA